MKFNTLLAALVSGLLFDNTAQAEISYQHIRNATAKIRDG